MLKAALISFNPGLNGFVFDELLLSLKNEGIPYSLNDEQFDIGMELCSVF